MRTIEQYNYNNKAVLLRVDLNVPVSDGKILDDTRIDKIIPTILYLLKENAKIIIASHFGRPKGTINLKYSLEFLSKVLSKKLGQEVLFCSEAIGLKSEQMAKNLQTKQILLLENLRFYPGEENNDPEFARDLAKLADFYINDAFSCSHRAHASIVSIAKILPNAAGLLLTAEIKNLEQYLSKPQKPMMAIIGGSKVSTKLDLLNNLLNKVDYLVIGGAMANTFLKSQGYEIGKSLYEPDLLNTAKSILDKALATNCQIILPQDVVVAKEISEHVANLVVNITDIPLDQMILDIGPATSTKVNHLLQNCSQVICNGPLGVFEYFPFSVGTTHIAREIAKLSNSGKIISIAGGGDMVAALTRSGLFDQFTYISTAGGAFLEWLEGKDLPGIEVLS